jgi:hypothetical protein
METGGGQMGRSGDLEDGGTRKIDNRRGARQETGSQHLPSSTKFNDLFHEHTIKINE